MDNENETSYKKITKTVVQAINDKNKKNKANIASLTNGGEIDEEYWAEKIRQFILDEVKTSKEYTKDEIDYVETSLRETREAGHSNTTNSEGGEEEHSAAASDGGEGEAKEAGHSNTANSKGGEEEHDYSVSESNVINLLKSWKDVKDEQLCRRQVRRARQRYMNAYS